MTHCNWFQQGPPAKDSIFLNYFYTGVSGNEGIVTTNALCNANPVGGYGLATGNGDHTRSIIGDKYYHYYYCNYNLGSTGDSKILINASIPANSTTNPFTANQACSADGYSMTATPDYRDMFGQRYLYHSQCRYVQTTLGYRWDVYYRSAISFGNTTPAAYCPGLSGYNMTASSVGAVDLLDTTNGK